MIFDPGWPTCAVCNKPVERMTRDDAPMMRKLTFVVECHGEVESVDLLASELVDAAERIKFTRAFASSRLLPAPK